MRDSYALVPAWGPIEDAPSGAILADVAGSHHIFDCICEAKELAVQHQRPVSFPHMEGITVTVHPDDDLDAIGRAWWQRVYGETPEETARRR